MSLLYWFPFIDGTFKNQGLNNYTSSPTGFTVENSGKIGKCIKATTQINTGIIKDNWDFTSSSISFGGWVKIKKDDLEAITSTKTYTSAYSTCGGILFGRDSYGGLGLRWKTNNIFNDGSLNAVILYIHIRNENGGSIQTSSYTIAFNDWTHVIVVLNREKNKLQLYINGILFNEKNCNTTNYATAGSISQGNFLINQASWDGGNGNTVSAPWWINDLRIYNHALSPKEVEEISKGLVLHYKLDQNLNVLNNCYSNPTFNTSSSSGGWHHWGPSGHAGTYSQNTNSQYIYNKANTYSHCVDNTASATDKHYLCYQSPSFSGGYRSLQFIIKEANGLPITETICRPAWNARDGGAPSDIWSEIIDLSNGFYLCKVNGLSQKTDDLVGIRIQPGYKIYISEGYLENDKEVCSDIFNQDNLTTIHDCSGYDNNGTVIGTLDAVADSPRYEIATVFNGTDSAIKVTNNNWCSQGMEALTINIWAKASSWSAKKLFSCTDSGGFNTESGSSGYLRFPVHVYTDAEKTSAAYKYDSKEIKISDLSTTDWVMITFVYDTTGTKTYINGELHHTYENTSYGIHFNMSTRLFLGCEANAANPSTPYLDGQESDFRIYATALSAAAIKELYDTSASIDASGNIYARELVE